MEKPFYSPADRRFRYIRTEILGPKRYDDIMRQLMETKGFDPVPVGGQLWTDADGLRRLHREGHVIGMHSHTHPTNMASLSAAEQGSEFETNRAVLTSILGEPPTTVAHPTGSYGSETLQILARLGIEIGFRADMAEGYNSRMELPRLNHAMLIKAMQHRGEGDD